MSLGRIVYGKNAPRVGMAPSIVLVDPKYSHNVGAVVRAASCYGLRQVWFTGDRVRVDLEIRRRLPREERMRAYGEVALINSDYPFDAFQPDCTPVAVELRPQSERLWEFEHPEKAVYVFGPEDGAIPKVVLRHCHRFVVIPSRHCLNLAAAVYTVLYDRATKRYRAGLDQMLELQEERHSRVRELQVAGLGSER